MANSSKNPYESPRGFDYEERPWWKRLRDLFFPPRLSFIDRFLSGSKAIFQGVVFQVDVHDDTKLYAMLPLGANEARRIRNNVSEAQRVLQILLQKRPELIQPLQGRNLVVVLVTEYDPRTRQEVYRETVPMEVWHAWREGEEIEAMGESNPLG